MNPLLMFATIVFVLFAGISTPGLASINSKWAPQLTVAERVSTSVEPSKRQEFCLNLTDEVVNQEEHRLWVSIVSGASCIYYYFLRHDFEGSRLAEFENTFFPEDRPAVIRIPVNPKKQGTAEVLLKPRRVIHFPYIKLVATNMKDARSSLVKRMHLCRISSHATAAGGATTYNSGSLFLSLDDVYLENAENLDPTGLRFRYSYSVRYSNPVREREWYVEEGTSDIVLLLATEGSWSVKWNPYRGVSWKPSPCAPYGNGCEYDTTSPPRQVLGKMKGQISEEKQNSKTN